MGDVPVLQPGRDLPEGTTYLPTTPATALWGRLPAEGEPPALRVEPGAVVTIDTVSHEGLLPDQGGDPLRWFASHGVAPGDVLADAVAVARDLERGEHDGPHVVTGPIEVIGARPGDVVSVTLLAAIPRVPYGVISNRHGRGALAGELPRGAGTVSVFTPVRAREGELVAELPLVEDGPARVRFPLAPFLGILGVTPAGGERLHSVPPGAHGGNTDIALAQVGSTTHLPVQVDGAGLYVGDPHFAQGDGEVCLTALEASLRVVLRVDLLPRAAAHARFGPLDGPLVETTDLLVPTGTDVDLDEAVRHGVRAALSLLRHRYGMAEHLAYAYLSAAADVGVSQVVDQVSGAHVRIRKADFPEVGS